LRIKLRKILEQAASTRNLLVLIKNRVYDSRVSCLRLDTILRKIVSPTRHHTAEELVYNN